MKLPDKRCPLSPEGHLCCGNPCAWFDEELGKCVVCRLGVKPKTKAKKE